MRNGKERRGRMHEHHVEVTRTARYFTLGDPSGGVGEVWVVCHGYGQLASRFLEKLRVLDDGTRYLVAPEGLSRFYLSESPTERRVGASWMTREDRLAEIADYVQYLDAVYQEVFGLLDRSQVTVHALGFSQGVATASRWTAMGKARVDRLSLCIGFSASCSASPSRVQATTTSTRAMPGAAATHGAFTSVSLPDAIMLPQDGVGGWTPRPRNDRPASSMIALPIPSAAATMTGVSALGRMWRHRILARESPNASAPSTNGRAASAQTSPWTRRATDIHPVTPSTRMTSAALGRHSVASNSSSTTRGRASTKSVNASSTERTGPRQ